MLNLLNLFSLKRSPLLSQFHILLMSCNFILCTLVCQFHGSRNPGVYWRPGVY